MKLRSGMIMIAFSVSIVSGVFAADSGLLAVSKDCKQMASAVVRTLKIPSGYHEGLMMEGGSIWVCNGKQGNIWIVDIKSGTVLSNIQPVAGFTESIVPYRDKDYLLTDWEEKKLYRIHIDNDIAVSKVEVSLAPAHPTGVVYTGKSIWVITWTRGMGTKFDIIEMDDEFKVKRKFSVDRIQEPAHLAWDGKSLWVTSWYRRLIFKIDTDKMEIVRTFRSPVPKTTGIAWDGKYFWVTGTYSDIYQIAVEDN